MYSRAAFTTLLVLSVPLFAADHDIGAKIVAFAEKHNDQQVGNGECAALVTAAFEEANAKPFFEYSESPGANDYVWGALLYYKEIKDGKTIEEGDLSAIRPGDIIQFRDAEFSKETATSMYFKFAPHHTSVVAKATRSAIDVWEQNSNGVRKVGKGVYHIDDLKKGWLRVYRPQSNR